ncbi:MAG: alpha-N-arabinofuranosidase [Lachnospiraceae bacterium]|nr:alpha-N-arabinofuranosidase [Lachnospiraceae bacterium]
MKTFKMLINAADKKGHINREIYGNFSEHLGRCIYNGIYVGEDSDIPNIHGLRKDIIDAMKNIKLPVLRWPGGCFADEYHWRDGIGPKSDRKKMVNTNWGGVVEDNSFGTHEFMEFCELVGCEPYISGNVGSGTVRELAEWVEYMTFDGISPEADLRKENGREKPWKLKYLGIGNENWGCGGNMRPEYYADQYMQFASFCKNYSGNELYKIACGPNSSDYNWTEVMMKNLNKDFVKGLSLHFYSIPDWNNKGLAAEFDKDRYYELLSVSNFTDELITRHTEIMNRYDPEVKVALIVDEWGTWFDVEPGTNPGFLYQQNTMRDAIVAALSLNIFNRHSERVKMANIAQAVNVLQAIILTEGEKMLLTPTYHVFDLYKAHQDGDNVYCFSENENLAEGKNVPMISSSASVKDGVLTLTVANCSYDEACEISCDVCNFNATSAAARILTGDPHDLNDFENSDKVVIKGLEVELEDGVLKLSLPACSVCEVTLK